MEEIWIFHHYEEIVKKKCVSGIVKKEGWGYSDILLNRRTTEGREDAGVSLGRYCKEKYECLIGKSLLLELIQWLSG